MRALVTGSAGFIGYHLVQELSLQGWYVSGLDLRGPGPASKDLDIHYSCDILDRNLLHEVFLEFRPEVVFHLAARTDLDGRMATANEYYATNIEGVRNILEAIRATDSVRRSICVSTQLVYSAGEMPLGDQTYDPRTAYGWSKVLSEKMWRESNGGGAEWVIVRPTTVWGPGMSAHYLRFFGLLRRGLYVHVGTEGVVKSYGYVSNVAYQMRRIAEASSSQVHQKVFYLADYEPIVFQEWVEGLRCALEAPRIRTVPRALAQAGARCGDVIKRAGLTRFPFTSVRLRNVLTPYRFDLRATREVCGPLPVNVEDAIRETAAWVIGHKEANREESGG